MIGIIDYGMGNVGSIKNMLNRTGAASEIITEPNFVKEMHKLILPGVGAFDKGVNALKQSGFWDVLNEEIVERKKPILGICLGMQLMTERSDEGELGGLGWFDAETVAFDKSKTVECGLKVPHMGWNEVRSSENAALFKDWEFDRSRFYFVHSFHVECRNKCDVAGQTEYGIRFPSAIEKENMFGVQFHPEKSHKYGMQLLKNFVELA